MAVYLDNNATTLLDHEVLQAMLPYMGQTTGNPSSVHRFGRLQRDAIEQARASVAILAGARPEQVIFTSGGTESNNLILRGFSQRLARQQANSRIAISAIEHMSLLERSMTMEMSQQMPLNGS
jgi:cysteine desulfurase